MVQHLTDETRDELRDLLDSSHDAPRYLVDLVRRNRRTEPILVAMDSGLMVGALTGSCGSNWGDNDAFRAFSLPPPPHAYLVGIYVSPDTRMKGVGRSLVHAFVEEAAADRCTFVGGLLDRTSDMSGRRRFFTRLGFDFDTSDRFGAPMAQLCP